MGELGSLGMEWSGGGACDLPLGGSGGARREEKQAQRVHGPACWALTGPAASLHQVPWMSLLHNRRKNH